MGEKKASDNYEKGVVVHSRIEDQNMAKKGRTMNVDFSDRSHIS